MASKIAADWKITPRAYSSSSRSHNNLVVSAILIAALIHLMRAQETRYRAGYERYSDFGVYKHVYPPFNLSQSLEDCTPTENTTCPLFVGVMFSFSSVFNTSGAVLGVQIALDQINDNPNMLPGYKLHYAVLDSKCDRTVALKAFHTHIINGPTKIGILGSGCSIATEATAELASFYNLTQLSCQSSSSELSNRKRFPTHFQVIASELNIAFGFYGMIKEFQWRRVSLFVQNENIFTLMVAKLKKLLNFSIDFREVRFDSSDGVDTLGDQPFDDDARIFILVMYPINAREMLCKAVAQGLRYPYSQFLLLGWFEPDWWLGSEEEQARLEGLYKDCSREARFNLIKYSLAPLSGYHTTDAAEQTDTGTTSTEMIELGRVYGNGSLIGLQPRIYYQSCYDATWIFALGLNKTLADIRSKPNVSVNMAKYNDRLSQGEEFSLQHFTYNNSALKNNLFHHLEQTDYKGIVGDIKFDANGTRVIFRVGLEQFRPAGKKLDKLLVANIHKNAIEETQTAFFYEKNESLQDLFPYGLSFDGVPNEITVTVLVGVCALFVILSAAGIVLALVAMLMHFLLRQKVVIRLSSPKLNFLVCIGAILLYLSNIVLVIPTIDSTVLHINCNIYPWLMSTGYSLCYGTIVVKMARVYFIFDRPLRRTNKPLQDWILTAMVLLLVFIDIIVLTVYTVVETVKNTSHVVLVPNKEETERITGETAEVTLLYIQLCSDKGRGITVAFLYGYKMFLQIVALIFAFSIRKVKIKGLNNAKYIAVAVYVTSMVSAIVFVSTYTVNNYLNTFVSLVSTGFFIGTTTILGLVMVPPLVGHFQDPQGEKIFDSQLGSSGLQESEKSKRALYRQMSRQLTPKHGSVVKSEKEIKERIKELEMRLSKPRSASIISLGSYKEDKESSKDSKSVSFAATNGTVTSQCNKKISKQLSVSSDIWNESDIIEEEVGSGGSTVVIVVPIEHNSDSGVLETSTEGTKTDGSTN